jgi:hypothetical protein
MDEKKKYTSSEATRYKGYKPLKYWVRAIFRHQLIVVYADVFCSVLNLVSMIRSNTTTVRLLI